MLTFYWITVDPCDDVPCQNQGMCTSHGLEFTCQCPSTHHGDLCENEGIPEL